MKFFSTLLVLAVLCITGCDCPDCGNVVSSANVNTIFVTKTPGGDFKLDPEKIIVQSSCNWAATNMTPLYLDFANTNGTGGVHYLPIGLTPEFFAAVAADINNFPEDATGDRKIGTVHFDSSCEGGFDVHVYLKGMFVLHFEANGGDGITPPDVVFVLGEDLLIPASGGMAYSPKNFVGWGSRPDGKGRFYKDGRTATFSGNTTLHAMWSGDGSPEGGPMYIYNHQTLNNVRNTMTVRRNYLVIADFDANYDEVLDVRHDSWTPIGQYYVAEDYIFYGVFDGNGHHITYTTNYTGGSNQRAIGLFGYIGNLGVLKNLTVSGYVDGGSYGGSTGGIVGTLFSGGTVTHCVSMCTVIHSAGDHNATNGAAGIVGDARIGSTVAYCVSTGDVLCETSNINYAAQAYAGGITGIRAGVVNYCISTSKVTARSGNYSYAGGIVGGHSSDNINQERVEYNVALNQRITSIGHSTNAARSAAGRVISNLYSNPGGTHFMDNNYALTDMLVQLFTNPAATITDPGRIGLDKIDGANVSSSDTQDPAWWTSKGFTDTNWDFTHFASNGYPLPKQ